MKTSSVLSLQPDLPPGGSLELDLLLEFPDHVRVRPKLLQISPLSILDADIPASRSSQFLTLKASQQTTAVCFLPVAQIYTETSWTSAQKVFSLVGLPSAWRAPQALLVPCQAEPRSFFTRF